MAKVGVQAGVQGRVSKASPFGGASVPVSIGDQSLRRRAGSGFAGAGRGPLFAPYPGAICRAPAGILGLWPGYQFVAAGAPAEARCAAMKVALQRASSISTSSVAVGQLSGGKTLADAGQAIGV